MLKYHLRKQTEKIVYKQEAKTHYNTLRHNIIPAVEKYYGKTATYLAFFDYIFVEKKQMKTNNENSIRDMRKKDVIESFFKSLKEVRKPRPFATQNEIIQHAMKGEAPRFYVTFENARRFVSMLMRKKKLPIINENKLAMYKEIYKRYIERVKDCSRRYKYLILETIIEEPAPSFYLDHETFRDIVYRTIRKRQLSQYT